MLNWNAVYHDLFETDDGALPGITFSNVSGDEIVRIYAHLRSRGKISSVDAHFWHNELESDQPIESVPNPAELVIGGKASSFHHCIGGITVGAVEVPELGVFVHQSDGIELDYRRGAEWDPAKVEALFRLLFDTMQMAVDPRLALDDEVHISETLAFAKAWDEFFAELR